MNFFSDFFEKFRKNSEHLHDKDLPQDIMDDLYNELPYKWGGNYDKRCPSHDGSLFDSPLDFMSEFEEMFNNFFKGFPMMSFPPHHDHEMQNIPHQEVHGNESTLQERMLNDKKQDKSNDVAPQLTFKDRGFHRPYRRLIEPGSTKEDRDLDEEVKTGDKTLDEILPSSDIDHNHSFIPSFSFGSFSSSVVVHDSNGVVKSEKTVRDSRGNEQVTITRRSDGKEHTITRVTDEKGNISTQENIIDLSSAGSGKLGKLKQDCSEPSPSSGQLSWYRRLQSFFINDEQSGENNKPGEQ